MARAMPPTIRTDMAEAQQILCPICHKPNLRRARFCQHCGKDIVLNNDGPSYYITRIIKAGGQGAVYETIGDDGQVYAVKEMLDRFTDDKERDEAIVRFEAEARMLQRLAHSRIPRVYTDFKDEGRQYLAMEFVRGEDLEELIQRQGALPEKQVLEWADQICEVLSYLHNHKPEPIIFRDMKPSNIMIEPNGSVKLIDFGIAKVFQRAERGTQIGTPGYAPPEQYQGLATIKSNIYALGATLHHMLTGRDPRDEPPFSFPPVYGLNPRVAKPTSEAIQRALQMKPEDRYGSVAEFRAALRPQPAQPPQVLRAPQTAALPAQPQVAVPPAVAPVTPPPAPARPAQVAPVRPAVPVQPPARPAAPPTQPPARPVAPPAQPAQAKRRGGGVVRWLFALLLVAVLAGGTLVFAFPDVVEQVVPGLVSSPQPTPQRFIQKIFTIDEQEIIVPPGTDVRRAYLDVFLQLAQQDPDYGPNARINTNAPPSFIGEPQKIADEANGTRYRASMQGFILVPQSP